MQFHMTIEPDYASVFSLHYSTGVGGGRVPMSRGGLPQSHVSQQELGTRTTPQLSCGLGGRSSRGAWSPRLYGFAAEAKVCTGEPFMPKNIVLLQSPCIV